MGQGQVSVRSRVRNEAAPRQLQLPLDVVEHDVLGDPVEDYLRAGRQIREALLDLSLEVAAAATQEGAEAAVEAELLSMMTHEIENRALQLAVTLAQPSSQLLEEQRGTVGRAQQKERIDDRHVNAFIDGKWGINPDRVGMLGFSAGGHLCVMATLHANERTYERVAALDVDDATPNFSIPVYPAYLVSKENTFQLLPEIKVTGKSPPMCLVHAGDDKGVTSSSGSDTNNVVYWAWEP